MKKVLLLSLSLLIGMAGFAQVKSEVAKQSVKTQKTVMNGTEVTPASNYAPSAVLPGTSTTQIKGGEVTMFPTMVTEYDLQTNSSLGNRIAAWPDGSVAVTATWDSGESGTSWPLRGTGYNFYSADDDDFGEAPEARQEPDKSGWPSICAYGDGEILASHNTGINVYYRATRGEGDWEFLTNLQSNGYEWTWPRVGATEDGSLHLICADQYTDAQSHTRSIITYFRSTDGGHTWVENPIFGALSEEYKHQISADDYVMATNGNRIAITFFSVTYDLFYMYSEDGGETWTKHIICEHPYKAVTGNNYDWDDMNVGADTDSIYWSDNSGSIAIGNDGTVHVTWAIGRWAPDDEHQWGYLSYWPFVIGCVYWNSNFENEQGTNVIPAWGDWSGDAAFQSEFVWPGQQLGGHGHTMDADRIEAMEEAMGNGNLHMYGYASELNPNDPEGPAYLSDTWNNRWGSYRTYNGLSTMPALAVDNDNSVYILYSGLSDKRIGSTPTASQFYLRSPFLHTCVDGEWQQYYEATVIVSGVAFNEQEAYSFVAYPNEVNGNVWFAYSSDDEMGLVLDSDSGGQGSPSENTIYAVRIAKLDAVTETRDVVYNIYPNPASDYICIAADASADATITFVNLAGQTVKTINTSLTVGQNSISIDLASGVYFCTVNANGFSKTTKVVVK